MSHNHRILSPLIRAMLLFSGLFSRIGWGVVLFASPFVAIFVAQSELVTNFRFISDDVETLGTVLAVERTSFEENEYDVYSIKYKYKVGNLDYIAEGFMLESYLHSVGDTVKVSYSKSQPNKATAEGLRSRPFGLLVLLVLIFPGIGLIFIFVGYFQGARDARILEKGELTEAKLVEQTRTNTKINDQYVIKYTFEFTMPDGRIQRGSFDSHKAGRSLTDEPTERIIYDLRHPERVIAVDAFPMKIEAISPNDISLTPNVWHYIGLIMAAVALAANVGGVYLAM